MFGLMRKSTHERIVAEMQAEQQAAKTILEKVLPEKAGTFSVGERIGLNGWVFRVKSVKPKEIRLHIIGRQ